MNTLYVYADECGGMPLDDLSKPFVGAAVSSIQPITGTLSLRFSAELLVSHLVRNAATPFLAHVKPSSGYGQLVAAKFAKMETMARARKLVTRTHEYLPEGGIAVRNMVWGHCLTQSVGQAFTKFAFRSPIARLIVTFDQKTLASGDRRLMINECRKIPQRLRDIVMELSAVAPRQTDSVLNNLQVPPSDVVIQWSDEPSAAGTEDGLHLADRLAWHYLRHLLKPTKPSFLELLAQAGNKDITYDVTPLIVAPIDPDLIAQWKRDTGLPEPGT